MVFNLEEQLLIDMFGGFEVEKMFGRKKKGDISKEVNGYINGDNANAFEKFAENIQSDEKISRRGFLGKTSKALSIGAFAMSGVGMFDNDADASYKDYLRNIKSMAKKAPPGIANCRDPAIIEANYRLTESGFNPRDNRNKYNTQLFLACKILKIPNIQYPFLSVNQIKENTPYIEPAYHYLCAKIGKYPVNENRLKRDNEALFYFADGIAKYFGTWIRRNGNYIREIENNMLSAIFTAAGKPQSDVRGYLEMDENEKIKYIQGWAKDMKKKDFNNQLVSAWSSFFLTLHYNNIKKKDDTELMREIEEFSKKIIGHPIRGPPYYDL